MRTDDIAIWSIRKKKRRKPFELRWRTGLEEHSRSFLTRSLADNFRSDLLQAARRGELFNIGSGLPPSLVNDETGKESLSSLSWFELSRKYVADRWNEDAAKTREGIVDALATATLALLDWDNLNLARAEARAAMRWALLPSSDPPDRYRDSIDMISRHSLPACRLSEPEIARKLRTEIGLQINGQPAAAVTERMRRMKLNTALEFAIELGVLEENPLRTVRGKKVRVKNVARNIEVDPRVVANPRQIEELLTAVTYVGSWNRKRGRRLRAFYATLYYAGTRPSEALGLEERDCVLPERGWGELVLATTWPATEKKFTSSGTVHESRGLKHRERGATRVVPAPPELVSILREHIDLFGTAPDGRIFHTEQGRVVGKSMYSRVWREARLLALRPFEAASPLAGTPYDLRHAALSLWLNSGVDPTEVAERAGNSVEVLFRRYAKCLHGRRERNNRLIADALAESLS